MKAFRKLSTKLINCIMIISLFLSTGITSVFAEENVEVTYDTLRSSISDLNNSITDLTSKTLNETIADSVNGVISSLEGVKSGIISVSDNIETSTIFGNYTYQLDIYVHAEESSEVITYKKDKILGLGREEYNFNNDNDKIKFNKGAQELTTTYKKAVDEISSLVETINKAKDVDSAINTLDSDVINTLTFVKEKIDEKKLYEIKVSELNTLVENLSNYVETIDSNVVKHNLVALKALVKRLDSVYDNTELDSLLQNISNEINEEYAREDNYNTYLDNYNTLLNQYINDSLDKIIEELLNVDLETTPDVSEIVRQLNELNSYDSESNNKFNSKIESKLNELEVPKTEEERLSGLNIINKLELLKDNNQYSDNTKQLLEEKLALYQLSVNTNISSLKVHGYEFSKEEIDSNNLSLYVAYDVVDVLVEVTTEDVNATYEVFDNTNLVVGKNTITIIVTAQNGYAKEYSVVVNRMEKEAQVGDVEIKEEPTVTPVNEEVKVEEEVVTTLATKYSNTSSNKSNVTSDNKVVEEEKSNTSDSSSKYDDELAEEDMNPLTIVLIIAGIGLVGFGIYMLFGKDEEEDIKAELPKKEQKVEIKKVEIKNNKTNTKKTTNKNNNSTKSTNKKNTSKKGKK